jgi:hypothetical protein
MSKIKKEAPETQPEAKETVVPPSCNDLAWTDYVLGLLSDDEKIKGNPTTDGLRRIFETALNCSVIRSESDVVQSPSPDNEKRATVIHSLSFVINGGSEDSATKYRTVSGAADVYWGNCDKVYRNHPVAVAETRAEGRALRRALKLRKVVAAEEIAGEIEDHPDSNTVSKITNNQINFIDVIAKRLNINVTKVLETNAMNASNIYDISHEDAVNIIRLLSKYQQDITLLNSDLLGYSSEWK